MENTRVRRNQPLVSENMRKLWVTGIHVCMTSLSPKFARGSLQDQQLARRRGLLGTRFRVCLCQIVNERRSIGLSRSKQASPSGCRGIGNGRAGTWCHYGARDCGSAQAPLACDSWAVKFIPVRLVVVDFVHLQPRSEAKQEQK